jgi:hypothetical protein
MSLKEILLKKLDSILNPKLENRVILSFLGLGTLLVGVPSLLAFTAVLKVDSGDTSFTAEISNGPDMVFVVLGVLSLLIGAYFFAKKQNREEKDNAANSKDILHCQYYVCRNFEILSEISKLNLKSFPADDPVLFKNHVFSSLIDIVNRHPNEYRHGTKWGKKFSTEEEYLKVYPHPDELINSGEKYPYFKNMRTLSLEEMKDLSKEDGVAHAMLESGLDAGKGVGVVGCYEAGCEGIEWQEEYLLRDLWCVFLSVENVSENSLSLKSLDCEMSKVDGFSEFNILSTKNCMALPSAPLKPGKSVLIPLAVALPPLSPIDIKRHSTNPDFPAGEYYQALSHCSINEDDIEDILVYGGIIRPHNIVFDKNGISFEHPVHPLNLSEFYEIDMHWGCGSCPHLFFVSNEKRYVRELLALCENSVGEDSFVVPDGVNKIIIAELEDEITQIQTIKLDGKVHLSDFELKKGEEIEIPVSSGQKIEVAGKYIPLVTINHDQPTGRIRNTIIYDYISQNSMS